ncbi:MAG: hypothetical protein ACR2IJ_07270 [Fluviibacter sp.]
MDLLEGLEQVAPVALGAGEGRLADDADECSKVGGFGERADSGRVGCAAGLCVPALLAERGCIGHLLGMKNAGSWGDL